jgi:hypothetical protein
VLPWIGVEARDAARPQAVLPADGSMLDLAQRSHVVSTHFTAAYARTRTRAQRMNHALSRAAAGLDQASGG